MKEEIGRVKSKEGRKEERKDVFRFKRGTLSKFNTCLVYGFLSTLSTKWWLILEQQPGIRTRTGN